MRRDLTTNIRHYYDTAQPPIEVDEIMGRVAERVEPEAGRRGWAIGDRVRSLPAWSAAVAGFAGVLLLGGVVGWLLAGRDDSAPVVDRQPGDTTSTIPAPADWDPILATTVAGTPPAAAGCPVGADPDAAGPADQDRPLARNRSNQTAVFDRHTGRIVYLDARSAPAPADTWTFDICTNTWQRMDPGGDPALLGNLVYDVDSDRTISFALETVAVYDANADAWTQRDRPAGFDGDGGAVYDPVSGLVIVQLYSDDAVTLAAYDVDTDRWTLVGSQTQPAGSYLVGYAAEIDRVVLQGYDSHGDTSDVAGPNGGLLDPRSGEMTLLPAPGPQISGGFGAFVYATGTDTAVIMTEHRGICRLDPTATTWEACVEPMRRFFAYGALVFDPLNQRLVLMNGISGVWWTDTTDGVWAIDLGGGGWHELVPATSTTALSETSGPGAVDPPGAIEGWSPILSVTVAGQAPPAASCPEGADPDVAGPVGQPRPWGAQFSNQAAVFDRHMGRIVFGDESGDTWAFDVCTNTWQQLQPEDPPPWGASPWGAYGHMGELVYDVDSDVTVAFAGNVVVVFDATTNTWARVSQMAGYETGMFGAVYDPVSGLIVVQTREGLAAYDVDTDTWTPLGFLDTGSDAGELVEDVPFLIGYVAETDQFVLADGYHDRGLLVEARTGAITVVGVPVDDLFAPFGRLYYATGSGTPTLMDGSICRLQPETLAWVCADLADGPGPFTGSAGAGSGAGLLAAIVEDPINDRTVLIYGYGPGFDGKRFYDVDDVWAVDFDTGEWALLLERTGGMTFEQDG